LKAVREAQAFKPDLIVALGGGSCIDVAKTVWVLNENTGIEVEDITPCTVLELERKAKLVAMPTTSGTGSEVSFWDSFKRSQGKTQSSTRVLLHCPLHSDFRPIFPIKNA